MMTGTPQKSQITGQLKCLYALQPWRCVHYPNSSEIEAYAEASGQFEVVAFIPRTSGAAAETTANFICQVINDHAQNKNLLRDAMEAFELVLEDNGLTFASEQAIDAIITRIKIQMR
jgi:hypothetical protein